MTSCGAREIPLEYLIYRINILKKAVFIILAISLAGLFFSRKFSVGFLVGGAIAMMNFSLLARHIAAMRDFALKKAKRYIMGKFLVMYIIMALFLFVAITKGVHVFIGTALGLLVIKFTIFMDGALVKYAKPL